MHLSPATAEMYPTPTVGAYSSLDIDRGGHGALPDHPVTNSSAADCMVRIGTVS